MKKFNSREEEVQYYQDFEVLRAEAMEILEAGEQYHQNYEVDVLKAAATEVLEEAERGQILLFPAHTYIDRIKEGMTVNDIVIMLWYDEYKDESPAMWCVSYRRYVTGLLRTIRDDILKNMKEISDSNKLPTISSTLVAQMVGREHSHVLRDIRVIVGHLGSWEEHPDLDRPRISDYYIPTEYMSRQNKKIPAYRLTRKGCDLYATRMTGAQGTLFSAQYVNLFHGMREQQSPQVPETYEDAIIALADVIKDNKVLEIEYGQTKSFYEKYEENGENMTVTQIAKSYGMTAQGLNNWLKNEGIQYKVNSQWVLHKKYSGKGYVQTHILNVGDNKEKVVPTTYWTPRGVEFIHNLLNKYSAVGNGDDAIC